MSLRVARRFPACRLVYAAATILSATSQATTPRPRSRDQINIMLTHYATDMLYKLTLKLNSFTTSVSFLSNLFVEKVYSC